MIIPSKNDKIYFDKIRRISFSIKDDKFFDKYK